MSCASPGATHHAACDCREAAFTRALELLRRYYESVDHDGIGDGWCKKAGRYSATCDCGLDELRAEVEKVLA